MLLRYRGILLGGRMHTLALAVALGIGTQAHATASISCGGIDGDVGVDVHFGAGPVPTVLDVSVSWSGKLLSTQNREGSTALNFARSYVDSQEMKIDLVDDQATVNLVTIRVVRNDSESTGPYQIGYVRVGEDAPIGILCDGP